MPHTIRIEERMDGGYLISVDGVVVRYALGRWDARFLAWRLKRKLRRGLLDVTVDV